MLVSLFAIISGLALFAGDDDGDKCYSVLWHTGAYFDTRLSQILDRRAADAGICFQHKYYHFELPASSSQDAPEKSCHKISTTSIPRTLRLMRSGRHDIDGGKVGGLPAYVEKGLLQTTAPWYYSDVFLVCRKGVACGPDSLGDLRVGGVRNVKAMSSILTAAKAPLLTSNFADLPKLLKAGRVDAVVMVDLHYYAALDALGGAVQTVKMASFGIHGWTVEMSAAEFKLVDGVFGAASMDVRRFKSGYLKALDDGKPPACPAMTPEL